MLQKYPTKSTNKGLPVFGEWIVFTLPGPLPEHLPSSVWNSSSFDLCNLWLCHETSCKTTQITIIAIGRVSNIGGISGRSHSQNTGLLCCMLRCVYIHKSSEFIHNLVTTVSHLATLFNFASLVNDCRVTGHMTKQGQLIGDWGTDTICSRL